MLDYSTHTLLKQNYDPSIVKGERLRVWEGFMDRLYEIEKERELKISNSLSTESNEKRLAI